MPSMKPQKKHAIPHDIFRMTMVIAICAFAVCSSAVGGIERLSCDVAVVGGGTKLVNYMISCPF